MIEWTQPVFFIELLVILTGSLVSICLCRRLRIPDIVAYLLAGAAIGPHALGWVRDDATIRFFAEFGVAFLLFELGLEFSPAKLRGLRRAVLGLGCAQMLVTTLALAGLLHLVKDYRPAVALVVGGALALSSTAIGVRELRRLKLTHRHHAQVAVGVLVFQDLAALLLLVLVPALAGAGADPAGLAQSILEALARAALAGGLLLTLGRWVLPRVFRAAVRAGADEVFILSILVIVLLAGWITHALGLSMAFGAFAIGVMLGESEFRHQVEMDIRPYRDMLMGLFFAGLGMRLELGLLATEGAALLAAVLILVAVKTVATAASALAVGESTYSAAKLGLILAQAGEFGFALVALAANAGLVGAVEASRIQLAALGSMALSPWLIGYNFEITQGAASLLRLKHTPRARELDHIPDDLADHVILAGYGRVGQMIARFLKANAIPYLALDLDSDLVKRGRARGEPVIYGSCGRIALLRACRIDRARLAILTFQSLHEARRVIGQIRALGYTLPIVVRTQHHGDCIALIQAGADHVVPEMFEASLIIAAEVLTLLGLDRERVEQQVAEERRNRAV